MVFSPRPGLDRHGDFIGLALALLSIGIVIYPFLKFRRSRRVYLRAAPPAKPGPETDPTLESIQEAIRTLDLEFDLGSIPEGLYREQLNDYQARISQITQRQSRASTSPWAESWNGI